MQQRKFSRIRLIIYGCLIIILAGFYFFRHHFYRWIATGHFKIYSVQDVLDKHELEVRNRLEGKMRLKGISWPPNQFLLLAFKKEQIMELWLANSKGLFQFIKYYRITGSSGHLGPKFCEGDMQVPEGFYDLVGLNPNSNFYLSIKVGYPNLYDINHSNLPPEKMGGNIFIHGGISTIGCIPVGDDNEIEELFCLAARISPGKRKIVIMPIDFRKNKGQFINEKSSVNDLYNKFRTFLIDFPLNTSDNK